MNIYFLHRRTFLLAGILLSLFSGLIIAQEIGLEQDGAVPIPGRQLNRQHVGNGSSDQVPFGAESVYDTSEYALGSYIHNIIFIQDDQLRVLDDREHPKVSADDCATINCGKVHWTETMLDIRKQRVEE